MTASRRKSRTRRNADEEKSVTDALREVPADPAIAALNDEPAPFGGDWELPQPSFTPNEPAGTALPAETGAQPMLAETELDSWMPVEPTVPPIIGDSIPAPDPLPEHDPEPEPEPGVDAVLYSGPGWAWLPTAQAEATREEMDLIVERGLGENAAETVTAFRHSRKRISDGARQLCAEVGQPEMAVLLLRRVSVFNEQARQERAVRGSGPQPAVPQGGRHARQPSLATPELHAGPERGAA